MIKKIKKIRKTGAIPLLTKLLNSNDTSIQKNATGSLLNLASHKSIKDSIIIYIKKIDTLNNLKLSTKSSKS